jgi:acetolactate synthase-1/2/3 large subunit
LADNGVRQAFGVVGNGNVLPVARMLRRGIRYVAARHEGGAIAMADAYYRVTGAVAVCSTTYGPGYTNIATGLTEAVKHRCGILVVVGDRPTTGRRRIDIDQSGLADALGASVIRIDDPAEVYRHTVAALDQARTGQRPVVLALPHDLLNYQVPRRSATITRRPSWHRQPDRSAIGAALDLLAAADRPLLLAGVGAWRAGAKKVLTDLGDRAGALYATTVMAGGMFGGSQWTLGICGGFASPAAARLIKDADLVVAFGASLNEWTLSGGRLLAPEATLVRVDTVARTEVDRVDLNITGDAAVVASALLDGANARGLAPSRWRQQVAPEISRTGWQHQSHTDASTGDRIDPRTLSLALAELLPEERTVVTDGGHFVGWPFSYLLPTDPAGVVFTGAAFQSIGLGFGGAVGAAVGRSDRLTVVALGDGGALMGLSDLETLVRTAESALVVIYDDAAYGFEVHVHGELVEDSGVFSDTDFAGIARALGAAGATTVRGVADLAALRDWCANGCRGTFVLDCKVVREVQVDYLRQAGSVASGGAAAERRA